jgi:hypothetical protein
MSPHEIRARLMELAQQRLRAECAALSADESSMMRSEGETVAQRTAGVVAAVTDLAVLHGQLYGRNCG